MAKAYFPHAPSPLQLEFLNLDAPEAFFGGAAGGGKSDAAMMAALQYVDVPGYSAATFRRTKPDLLKPGGILDRAKQWLAGTAAKWDEDIFGFRFPSGATWHFGYAANFKQLEDAYQGSQFQYIGIDELGQWPERMYRYLFSRLRPLKGVNVPPRMRATGNPGGTGGAWVRRRFIENAVHARGTKALDDLKAFRNGQALPSPRVYESPPSSEAREVSAIVGKTPRGAVFIPSFGSDNPGLDMDEYRLMLANLTPTDRARLEWGDWDATSDGKFFQQSWFKFADVAPSGLQWLRSWDFAATEAAPGKDPDWTAGAKLAIETSKTGEKRLWIADVKHFQEDPGGTEDEVRATAEADGKKVRVLVEQEPGSAGKSAVHGMKTRVLFGWIVEGFPRTGPKDLYWRAVSSIARAGNVTLVRGAWNAEFLDELSAIPNGHDDQADCVAAGFAHLTEAGSKAARARAMARE